MDSDRQVRTQLVALLRGGNAHMDFAAAVADFPEDKINAKPANVAYSFWHLIEHIRLTQRDILAYMTTADYQEPHWPIDYWPPTDATATREQWDETIAGFTADLEHLIAFVQDPSFNLTGPVPSTDEHTMLREILVVADHNAYHIGELGILRQVEGAWGPGHE